MEKKLIFEGKATLEDLYVLNNVGFEFVVEGGKITKILDHDDEGGCLE